MKYTIVMPDGKRHCHLTSGELLAELTYMTGMAESPSDWLPTTDAISLTDMLCAIRDILDGNTSTTIPTALHKTIEIIATA